MNVYTDILPYSCICSGDTRYSTEAMRVMLRKSGMTREEIQSLYDLNQAPAMIELEKLNRSAARVNRSDWTVGEDWPIKELAYNYEKMRFFFGHLVFFQIAMSVVLLIGSLFYETWKPIALFFILAGITYLMAYLSRLTRTDICREAANMQIIILEHSYKKRLYQILGNYERARNVIENTHRMYDCMKEYLETPEA